MTSKAPQKMPGGLERPKAPAAPPTRDMRVSVEYKLVPVAYLRKDQLRQVQRMGTMLGEIADSPRVDRVPVYAAPQPAEQQPAPVVAGLTEALRQYQHNDGSGLVFGYDKILVDQYVAALVDALVACTRATSAAEVGLIVDAALAAYRKHRGEA